MCYMYDYGKKGVLALDLDVLHVDLVRQHV